MKNVKELRTVSSKLVKDLSTGKVDHKTANVMVRTMNTSISSAKAQISHYRTIGSQRKIGFLVAD